MNIRLLATCSIAFTVLTGIALLPICIITQVQPLVISGGSMEPAYRVGDVVLMRRGVGSSEVEIGDVITYIVENGTLVTHRIDDVFEREQGLFWRTIGDANEAPDPNLVFEGQLRGLVLGRLPMGTLITLVYRNDAMRTILYLVPLLILAAPWLGKVHRENYSNWRRARKSVVK